jgi:hypothetical protein
MPDDAGAGPSAGALFAADVAVPGVPEPLFGPVEPARACKAGIQDVVAP